MSGRWELILGDCREVLTGLDRKSVAAVVTDPPYGIGQDNDGTRFTGNHPNSQLRTYSRIAGDDRPFQPAPFLDFPRVILWGANFYSDRLPSGGWLVWVKKPVDGIGKFCGDCEVGWAKGSGGVHLFHHVWAGWLRETERGRSLHPHQKPVALWKWVLERLRLPAGSLVFDPYAGSASVGEACLDLGLRYLGCEIDPTYHAAGASD